MDDTTSTEHIVVGEYDGDISNITTRSAAYNEDDADFTLVSSDGIHFRAHTFMIKRASTSIFADAQYTDYLSSSFDVPTRIVHLEEPTEEHSIVIKVYLDLLYGSETYPLDIADYDLCILLIRFCRKWNSFLVKNRIRREIEIAIQAVAPPDPKLFLLALELYDHELLELWIARQGVEAGTYHNATRSGLRPKSASIPGLDKYEENEHGMRMRTPWPKDHRQRGYLDLGCWKYEDYARLPVDVAWALMNSVEASRSSSSSADRNAQLADHFVEQLTVLGYFPDEDEDEDDIDSVEAAADDNNVEESSSHHSDSPSDPEPRRDSLDTRYKDANTDMIIVSSDNIYFYVHSSVLQRASPVLADMVPLAQLPDQRTCMPLTDETIETSSVVSALLDILHDSIPPPFKEVQLIANLITLADKWEIPSVNRLIKSEIERSFYATEEAPFDILMVAYHLGEYGLAGDIIERYEVESFRRKLESSEPDPSQRWPYPLPRQKKFRPNIRQEPCDPTNVPHRITSCEYKTFSLLPKEISWALLRAEWCWDPRRSMAEGTDELADRRTSIAKTFRYIFGSSGLGEDWGRQRHY